MNWIRLKVEFSISDKLGVFFFSFSFVELINTRDYRREFQSREPFIGNSGRLVELDRIAKSGDRFDRNVMKKLSDGEFFRVLSV